MKYKSTIVKLKAKIHNGNRKTVEDATKYANELLQLLDVDKKVYQVPIVTILNDIGFKVYATKMPKNISGYIIIGQDLKEKLGLINCFYYGV